MSEPDPRNKTSHSHYKTLSKLTEICWRWLIMTDSYSVQRGATKPICGPHVKSRTLEIKPRVHTTKFYRNWLKFIGDDLLWPTATLCKAVRLNQHVGPCQELDPRNKISCSHYKILSKLTEIFRDDSVWLAATLCKIVWLDLYVDLTSREQPLVNVPNQSKPFLL